MSQAVDAVITPCDFEILSVPMQPGSKTDLAGFELMLA